MRMSRVAFITALAAACHSSAGVDLPDPGDSNNSPALQLPGGLVQHVSLSPAVPAQGQNVTIRSVIVNKGSAGVALSSRICSLDLGGTLRLSWPPSLGKCGGYSMSRNLAPGDSVLGFDTMRVDSSPGEYSLRVRHALSPEGWYELKVRVSSAGIAP